MKASPDQQRALLSLADADEAIRRKEHTRANLPEQQALDHHVDTLQKVEDELIDAVQVEERLSAESRRLERRIDEAETARKTHEAQMYSGRIQSERELGALREEIAAAKRKKSDLEDSLLETMEQVEEVTSLLEELRRRKAELEGEIADLTTRRDEAAGDIDSELATARDERARTAAGIDEEVVAFYEDLRARRTGRVVARLDGRTCTGCMLELTAIELEDIKRVSATSLARCEQCNAIIVPV